MMVVFVLTETGGEPLKSRMLRGEFLYLPHVINNHLNIQYDGENKFNKFLQAVCKSQLFCPTVSHESEKKTDVHAFSST